MAGRRTVGGYRIIDLCLWLLIIAVYETVATKAAMRFTNQPYWVSVVPAVTAIVMMRWGSPGLIHAAAGGLITCFAAGAGKEICLIYCAGNLLSGAALLIIKTFGKERLKNDTLKSLLYAFTVAALMLFGRVGAALAFGRPFEQTAGLLGPEAITLLFTVMIIWIVRRLDGVFEDQKAYLLRIRREQEAETGEMQ